MASSVIEHLASKELECIVRVEDSRDPVVVTAKRGGVTARVRISRRDWIFSPWDAMQTVMIYLRAWLSSPL